MAIYDPAALAIPRRAAYHLQSQADYEDGDGASILSVNKPKFREINYKPAPLRWPFLVCQILLLLLCISLVASALVLMPNSDTNAVILTPSASAILQRRQQVVEGGKATTIGAETESHASQVKTTGEEKRSIEDVGSVEKATATTVEGQTTAEKTTAFAESAPAQSPNSVTSRENSGGGGGKEGATQVETTQLETTQVKTTQATHSEAKPSTSAAEETKNQAKATAVTTSAEHAQQIQPETTSITTKQTKQTTENNSKKTTSIETTSVEATRAGTTRGETTSIVAQTDSGGNHVPTETTTTTASPKTREESDPTTGSYEAKGPASSQLTTFTTLTASEELKASQGTSLADAIKKTSTTRLENTQPTSVEYQTPETTVAPGQETSVKDNLPITDHSTNPLVQTGLVDTSTAVKGTTEVESISAQQPPGTSIISVSSTPNSNVVPATTRTSVPTTSTGLYTSVAGAVSHQDEPPMTASGQQTTRSHSEDAGDGKSAG